MNSKICLTAFPADRRRRRRHIAGRCEPAHDAAGVIPKTAVGYQNEPKDGHQCSGCKLFIPGADAAASTACASRWRARSCPTAGASLFVAKDA